MCILKQPVSQSDFRRYYHFRWRLLRQPWGQAAGSEVDDIEAHCFHIMAVNKKNLIIGVARLQFNANSQAQIRYMAIDPLYRKQGIGRQIITELERQAKANKASIIVLDAREKAVGFYQKLGYQVLRKSYLLFDEIQHFRMQKTL